MRSGFPLSQGGAYSAFQHWRNVALPSPQGINVTPAHVVHLENELQNNHPGDLRVACGPAQLHQGYGQSQQNLQGLHHQQDSQARVVSPGFHHPTPEDCACTSQNSHHRISREGNADYYSSAQVSAQHSSYFGTLAYENSVRQSVKNCEQQKDDSKQKCSRHFLKSDTGLQQRCHLNCASLVCTSSAPLDGVAAQTFPLQDQKRIPSNSTSLTTTILHFSDERHGKEQQVNGSQAALNSGWTRTQNLNHSGGTCSTPHQQQISSQQAAIHKVLPFGEMEPPTDEEIHDFIEGKLAFFRTVLAQKRRNSGHNAWDRSSTLLSDCTMPDSVAHCTTTSASDKAVERQRLNCAVIEECIAADGQDTELIPKFKETDKCATSASMKHSTVTQSMPASGSCKLVYSGDRSGDQSFVFATLIEIDSETEVEEARPQYEDISDNDAPQLVTTLPNTEHEELSIPACIKDPQYEDISDTDRPQNEYMTVETCQVPEPNDGQSSSENEGYEHVQSQSQMKTEIIPDGEVITKQQISPKTLEIAQQCSCSYFVETDDGFEELSCPKCNHNPQTNHSGSNSPSSVLEAEAETDDEMDYDCFAVSILDLQFEPGDEDQDSPGKNVQEGGETGDQERPCDTSPTPLRPVLAFDFPQLPVYDTKEIFIQAMKCRFEVASRENTPEHELVSEETQNRRQSIDSCETEDSCDYSSASEHNYLTVSRKMLKKRSAPCPSETDVSASEKEGEGDEVSNTQKGRPRSLANSGCLQKLRQLIEVKAGCSNQPKTNEQEISQNDDVIVIVSDTEDESDHYCKKSKRKRKEKRRLFSSESEDSGDASWSQQKRHSPKTVGRPCGTKKGKSPKSRLPSADTPTPQHHSNHDTLTEDMLQDSCSDLSHSTEKRGQLTKSNAAPENVNQVIIFDSDTEDDSDQKYKKQSRRKFFSSESDSGDAPCVEPETRLCSADSSLLQYQSQLHDTQLKDVMPDACAEMSNNRGKSGQVMEANGGSAHVRHEANGQTAPKRRAVTNDSMVKKHRFSKKKADKRRVSSGSGDSSDDLFATKDRPSMETVERLCGSAKEKPQKYRPSPEDSPEQQPPPVDREVDLGRPRCPLGSNPVIQRLIVKPSPFSTSLILLEKPKVHKQSKTVTWSPQTFTAFSKNSCEKNDAYLSRNKPANDRHPATKNNLQANIPKLRTGSRQLSEDGLSSASSRGLSLSGETSVSSSLSTSKQSTSVPRQYLPLPKLQRSHSYSSPSTSSSETMPLSAKEQLNKGWKESFYPTKWDKKNSMRREEDFRVTNDSLREARPGPSHHEKTPRQRHKSACMRREEDFRVTNDSLREARPGPSHHEKTPRQRHKSDPPLLKKIKNLAIQRTKDINRDGPKERGPVGEGYKWSQKPTVAKPTKGSSRM